MNKRSRQCFKWDIFVDNKCGKKHFFRFFISIQNILKSLYVFVGLPCPAQIPLGNTAEYFSPRRFTWTTVNWLCIRQNACRTREYKEFKLIGRLVFEENFRAWRCCNNFNMENRIQYIHLIKETRSNYPFFGSLLCRSAQYFNRNSFVNSCFHEFFLQFLTKIFMILIPLPCHLLNLP